MDMLNEQSLEFWKALNNHHVFFLMVGGFAVRFNGYNRATDDVDLWLKDSLENRKNFRKTGVRFQRRYSSEEPFDVCPTAAGNTAGSLVTRRANCL